jgi:hypothetical protein
MTEHFTEQQMAFGRAFADFKQKTRVNSEENAKIPRCEERVRRGTGTGFCDTPLDEHGNCPNGRDHLS